MPFFSWNLKNKKKTVPNLDLEFTRIQIKCVAPLVLFILLTVLGILKQEKLQLFAVVLKIELALPLHHCQNLPLSKVFVDFWKKSENFQVWEFFHSFLFWASTVLQNMDIYQGQNFQRCYSRSRVSYAKERSGDGYFHSSIDRSDKDFESIVST